MPTRRGDCDPAYALVFSVVVELLGRVDDLEDGEGERVEDAGYAEGDESVEGAEGETNEGSDDSANAPLPLMETSEPSTPLDTAAPPRRPDPFPNSLSSFNSTLAPSVFSPLATLTPTPEEP